MKSRVLRWLLLVSIVVAPTAVAADSAQKDGAAPQENQVLNAKQEVEGFWKVDAILDQAVKNIAIRYNLNDRQTEITGEMMRTGVTRFLDEHQDEIWPLIRDLVRYQRKGAPPDPEAATRLGPIASRILLEARKEIFRSNEEWGKILTPEQRRVHEYDLREMTKTFQAMEHNFQDWEEGRVASGSIFPQPKPLVNEPPMPPKPQDGILPSKSTPKAKDEGGPMLVSHFEAYVQKFIADYKLTATQRETAHSILREIKERTAAFRDSRQAELQTIKRRLTEAKTQDQRRKGTEELRRITQPLNDLFAELKARLDQIPDQAQRQRYVAKSNSRTSLKSAISGSRGKRRPADEPPEPTDANEDPENR